MAKNKMKTCKHCGAEIAAGAKVCPHCGGKNKAPIYQRPWFIALIVILVIGIVGGGSGSKKNNGAQSVSGVGENNTQQTTNGGSSSDNSSVSNPGVVTDSKQTLAVGDVIKDGDWYIGVSHVKQTGTYTYMNTNNDVESGYDALYVFFEVFNNSSKLKTLSTGDFSVYVDSQKAGDIDTIMKLTEDDVHQLDSYRLDGGTKVVYLLDAQVVEGWNEIDIFYKNFKWHISADDVDSSAYSHEVLINETVNRDYDEIGKTFGDKEYEVVYDGFTVVPARYGFEDDKVIFKYTVKNITDDKLDMNLVGYQMRCYHNNYLIGDASYTYDDQVDGYLNIFKVDEIQSGMTAKVYLAFDCNDSTGTFYNVFDVGYISNNVLGSVYISN